MGASPLSGPAGPAGPTPADNYSAPPGAPSSYGPTPTHSERRSAPVSRGPNWGAIIFVLILLLGGGGFAYWWFMLRTPSPAAVVQQMADAAKAGDFDKWKECITRGSLALFQQIPGGEDTMRQAMKKDAGQDAGLTIGATTYEDKGATAIVNVTATNPKAEQMMSGMGGNVDLVLIREEGKWKLDFMATGMRASKKMGNMPGAPGMRGP